MTRNLMVTALVAVLMAGFVLAYRALVPVRAQPLGQMASAGEMAVPGAPAVPPVRAYVEGEEILFIHTEASDPKIAELLTDMMASPVITVPSLAKVPEAALAPVYVFANGVKPEGARGPLGFQPDVFDGAPREPGYSPLRAVHVVTWKDPGAARLLRSAAEVREAEAKGKVTVEQPGVVVNMPFLTWPRGRR